MKKVSLAVALALAGASAAQALPVVTRPDWLRKPTGDDIANAYPVKALKAGRAGNTVIECTVNAQGLLRDCKVTKEDPPGFGFGAASLVLSGLFLMKPQTRDGQAVDGARITIPINWTYDGDPIENEDGHTGSRISGNDIAGQGPEYASPTVFVFGQMVWAQAPSVTDIKTALDQKVGDRFADGKVVLQCSVAKKTGALSNCATLNYSPGMEQFQAVARSLTSKFRADPKVLAEVKENAKVNLALSFPDMASPVWGQRYLSHAQWIRQPTFDPGEKLFPKEAVKAGLKTGSATVDCVIAANGDLTQCSVVAESIPGVGFGDMAKRVAMGFATNPWTDEGVPAEGAHVKLPIQMVDEDASPTPATKP
jgi:Gram-negative bacterial TonB protein C-terminal